MASNGISWFLDLNTSGFSRSIKGAQRDLSGLASTNLKQLIAPLAGIVASVGSVGAIGAGIKSALDLGSEMTDLSNRTGIAVESLYGLKVAFKDAGMDAQALGPAVNKMQKALSSAAGGGKEANVLKGMGLDPQSLASMDPGQAFAKIGNAIASLPNSTERAAASMALFGKSGAELLQVFMDPNFKNAGDISNTAKILGENAGIFDKASDSLGRVGGKLQGLFVGLASGSTSLLDNLANFIDGLDLSGLGQRFGAIVGNFSTNFSDEWAKVVQFLQDSISIVFSQEGLSVILDGFYYIGAQIRDFLVKVFKTPLDYLEAGLQKAIESAMEMVGKIPMIGDKLGLKGFQASSLDSILADVQARGNGLTNLSAGDQEDKNATGRSFNERLGKLTEELKRSLQPVTTATAATNAANAAAVSENKNRITKQGVFNPEDIGMAGKSSIVADSLAKVGGGGISIGGMSNPILEENKRQTALLQRIAENGSKMAYAGEAAWNSGF